MNQIQNKKAYYDVLKGGALFLVLYNHTYAFSLYQTSTVFWDRVLNLIIVTITALNWPLFFMISGALLFDKDESIKDILFKRVLRFSVVLLVYQVIIMLLHIKTDNYYYTSWQFIYGIITNNYDGAYQSTWYLYAYLGFLIMLPILKKISLNITLNEFIYILIIIFLYHCLLPITQALINWKCNLGLQLSVDFRIPLLVARECMYPIVGYYIDKKLNSGNIWKNKKKLFFLFALMTFLSVYMEYISVYKYGQSTYPYSAMFIVFLAGYVLVLTKNYLQYHDAKIITKTFQIIGQNSFGIYLSAPIIQTLLYDKYCMITINFVSERISSVL